MSLEQQREQLIHQRDLITQQIGELDRQIYNAQPSIFTVTDERSGRVFTMQRNSYETSLKYPKVHPKTGQRIFERTNFWTKHNGKYCVVSCLEFKEEDDTEYAELWYTNNNGCYKLYDDKKGWSKKGYYWNDVSYGDYSDSVFVETKIPYKDDEMPKKRSRKNNK